MRRLPLLPLIAVAALCLATTACDDKKTEEQSAQQTPEQTSAQTVPQTPPPEAVRKSPIELGEAIAYATAEGSKVGAVFMRISNMGKEEEMLKGVTATVGTSAELHRMATDEKGTMQMRNAHRFTIKPNNHLVLNPVGSHIMLLGLTKPLKEGETFNITLDFDKAPDMTVPVTVVAPAELSKGTPPDPNIKAHTHHMMMGKETPAKANTQKPAEAPAMDHEHMHMDEPANESSGE